MKISHNREINYRQLLVWFLVFFLILLGDLRKITFSVLDLYVIAKRPEKRVERGICKLPGFRVVSLQPGSKMKIWEEGIPTWHMM